MRQSWGGGKDQSLSLRHCLLAPNPFIISLSSLDGLVIGLDQLLGVGIDKDKSEKTR